ncbi:Sugar isomerase (SIS) [Penicillium expansum]|nr:Sugar isomerase (SIS) [Penicillium expansum]
MSGEPKHVILALVDEVLPLAMILTPDDNFLTHDDNFSKLPDAYNQVITRNGRPIVICNTDYFEFPRDKTDRIEVPRTVYTLQGLLNVIPLAAYGLLACCS